MKLPNVSRGPVLLLDIDYAPKLSEETFAFTATVSVSSVGACIVSNDGHGGANRIRDRRIAESVSAYAASLPEEPIGQGRSVRVDADFLISLMVGEAITAREERVLSVRRKLARA